MFFNSFNSKKLTVFFLALFILIFLIFFYFLHQKKSLQKILNLKKITQNKDKKLDQKNKRVRSMSENNKLKRRFFKKNDENIIDFFSFAINEGDKLIKEFENLKKDHGGEISFDDKGIIEWLLDDDYVISAYFSKVISYKNFDCGKSPEERKDRKKLMSQRFYDLAYQINTILLRDQFSINKKNTKIDEDVYYVGFEDEDFKCRLIVRPWCQVNSENGESYFSIEFACTETLMDYFKNQIDHLKEFNLKNFAISVVKRSDRYAIFTGFKYLDFFSEKKIFVSLPFKKYEKWQIIYPDNHKVSCDFYKIYQFPIDTYSGICQRTKNDF